MRSILFLIIFVVPLILTAGQTGKIAGVVTDAATGELLIGVNVYLENQSFGAATDMEGDYIMLNIPPGRYTAVALMVGYREMRVTGIEVEIDRTTRIDFNLQTDVLETDVILVEAERPLIQRDLTATSSSVSAREIAAIPVENMKDILQIQAGIIVDANGDMHLRGGRANEIAYMIDGVSVSDPYSGRLAVSVNQDAIQELKVISGTFNAEYGKVMSGVVEVITKDPTPKFNVGVSFYTGDYISSNNQVFYNIDDINPTDIYNAQVHLSGPMPVLQENLSYYVSFRRYYNDGWMYGQQRFLPSDSSEFYLDYAYLEENGNKEPVAMNFTSQYFGNIKLVYKFLPELKLSYNFVGNYNNFHNYNHLYKYNPDGDNSNYQTGYTHIVSLNHTISNNTFYTMKLSHYLFDYKSYLYEDINDPRYQDPELLRKRQDAFSFLTGGTNMAHNYRTSTVTLGRFDITSQVNKTHLVKGGIEYKYNNIKVITEEALYNGQPSNIFNPDLFFNGGTHIHKPIEFAAYMQDKVELDNMTLNIGLRYDFFNSEGKVPTDLRDPSNERQLENAYRKAEPEHQFSPRVGIAFPISSSGVIHASYGQFFQIPDLIYLYTNPRFAVLGGLNSILGNTELKPQSTVIYEVGLQQEFQNLLALHITGFYKDIRNLLGTNIYETYTLGDRYARYENRDYGNIKGITLSFKKRPTAFDYLTVSLDYTFQIAEGNASDPNHVFYNNQANPPRATNIQVVPLDWDQTHTINLSASYNNPDIIGIGLIGQFQSGLPYSPAFQNKETTFENSGRKPINYSVDLRISKDFYIDATVLTAYIKVYNLFDRLNEMTVYTDTGRSGYSLVSQYSEPRETVNTLDEWLTRPDFYVEPRRVLIGLSLEL
jgi:outer membrane receptor for ferrienterochelin and colicin